MPLEGWAHAVDPAPGPPALEAPAAPPALAFVPVEGTVLLFRGAEHAHWLRATVPPLDARDPVVLVPKAYVTLAAYVDGVRVYDLSDVPRARGMPFHVVPLPRRDGPVEITLRTASRYTQTGLPEGARAGERADLIASLLPRDLPRLAVAALFLVIGGAALSLAVRGRERRTLVGLALFSIGMALWALFHTRTRQLWLPSLELWFAAWWISVPIVSLGAATFLDAVWGPGPWRMFRALVISFVAITALALVSLVSEGALEALSPAVFFSGRAGAVIGLVAVTIVLARLAWRGDRDARIFAATFAIATVAVTHDIAVSVGVPLGGGLWADWGYVAVEIGLVAIVRRRFSETEARVAEYAAELDRYVVERDALVRDLHDGLGGIVTNVRMIAERGARGAEGAPRDGELFAAIEDLAAEGMAELRTLMSGFDDLPSSYREVASELRRSGASALEARDVAHELALEIAADAPRPELAVVVHVARIHREAITNALKHSGARRVSVRLAVDRAALELTIDDDGRGLAPDGDRGSGRGLGSMRARARELGGELTIAPREPGPSGGTRITLRVPLAKDVSAATGIRTRGRST